MAEVYDFSPTFQSKILALLWRDATFYTLYRDVIKAQYFESVVHIDLARMVFDYYEKYEVPPTVDAILEETRVLCNSSEVKKKIEDDYFEEIERASNATLEDEKYIRDKVIQFGKRQAMSQAIVDSLDDVKAGRNYDIVEKRVKSALEVGSLMDDLGMNYFEGIEDRIDDSYNEEEEEEKIPTGVSFLDRKMKGGLGRKELGIVIAPPGTGKTLTLVNIGSSAIMVGKNVLHVSLEMSEKRMAKRYDSRMLKKNNDYIKANKDKVKRSLSLFPKHKKGKLVIKEFPPRVCTITTIKSLLTKLRISKGFIPDVIIIDYPDLMKASSSYGERRHEIEFLYEECRALGVEFDCAIWGASQTNRGALEKDVVTIADLAESFGKAAVADFMIAISQTRKEKRQGQLRYFVAKHRNGEGGDSVHCDVHYELMYVESNEERQAAFDMDDDEDDDMQMGQERKRTYTKKKDKSSDEDDEESEDNLAGGILGKIGKNED